jgi:hypothetical protein
MAKSRAQQAAIAISMKKAGKKPKSLTKAQNGKIIKSSGPKPTYSNLRGSGWDYFKTPSAKDSSDYRKGFEQGLKKSPLKQFPSPSGPTVRGYNEGFKKASTKKKG